MLNDPELYKSFDVVANAEKPYVRRHMKVMRRQLVELMTEAIAKRRLRGASPEKTAEIVWEAMMAFHHPKLVAEHIDEKTRAAPRGGPGEPARGPRPERLIAPDVRAPRLAWLDKPSSRAAD